MTCKTASDVSWSVPSSDKSCSAPNSVSNFEARITVLEEMDSPNSSEGATPVKAEGTNVEIQLTDSDGKNYSCKVTESEIAHIQSDESYRTGFMEKLKTGEISSTIVPPKSFSFSTVPLYSSVGDREPKIWKKAEADELVKLRIDMDEEFQQKKVHVDLWQRIAGQIVSSGGEVTPNQAANKWKSLKRSYTAYMDGKVESFQYIDEFNLLFHSGNNTPRYSKVRHSDAMSSSSMALRRSNKKAKRQLADTSVDDELDSASELDDECLSEEEIVTPSCNCIHTCHKRKREKLGGSNNQDVCSFLKEFVDIQRENIFHQQNLLQKQDETLSRFDRFLTNLLRKKKKASF